MQLRGFVALSLCALIGVSSPAFAESKIFTSILKTEATASAQDPAKVRKNAKTAKEMTPAEKKAAEKKAREAAAKAKAAEKQKLAAKAKAEADKKLAEKKKAEEAKKLARAKELAEKKAAAAKAAELKKAAKAKAEQERLAAKAKALEEKQQAAKAKADAALAAKLAKEKAREDARLAKLKAIEDANQARVRAAEASRQAELAQLASMDIARTGNNGELRSETLATPQKTGFLGLFGAAPTASMLPETRALDAALEQQEARRKFKVRADFEPQTVQFPGYEAGTIVIDTSARYLYLVQSSSKARRYAIAVGREGLQFKGNVTVGDKQEWPRWIPTQDMQKREPHKYGQYKDGMAGGPSNPLGARAIYLYQGRKDTYLRIHGTNQPETIGTNSSNGCFRMVNEHVKDLYSRVKMGTHVIVM
ncbi:L,D-transpeptidase [Arvimicrobium flavum]|uniref:L,D-transpeptidase n=1 Tax=Arvimicrobium flavum TaxID=3393320 RepID=UPI00237C4372|nr:L,D-transpeptidase [Mesorhizobium shangrilense]